MTNSFGGFSGPDIEDFLSSIQSDFVSMVTSNSVILNSYQSKQDEVIRIASKQV